MTISDEPVLGFQGELLHGGRVVLERVVGLLGVRTHPDGSVEWSGTFIIPAGGSLLFGDYTLSLDDGRAAGIHLSRVAAGPSQPAVVPFTVSGAIA